MQWVLLGLGEAGADRSNRTPRAGAVWPKSLSPGLRYSILPTQETGKGQMGQKKMPIPAKEEERPRCLGR